MTTAPDQPDLSHVRADGSAHMVDVSEKDVTDRSATATATLVTRADVVDRILDGSLPKGEVIGTARIAAIMAVKKTSDLVPLCHPLPIAGVQVDITATGTASGSRCPCARPRAPASRWRR